jgi:hypothetical protein
MQKQARSAVVSHRFRQMTGRRLVAMLALITTERDGYYGLE